METLERTFNDQKIEMRTEDVDVWIKAADVTETLELNNTSEIVGRLDSDEKEKFPTEIATGFGGSRVTDVWHVNEPGIYRLIFTSQAEAARDFKRWLAHDVLPELRRTGEYSARSEQAEDLPKKVIVEYGDHRMSHWLTEDDVYTRITDVYRAAGVEQVGQLMNLEAGSYWEVEQDIWVDEAGLNEWMYRSNVKGTSEFVADYGSTVQALQESSQAPVDATAPPMEGPEGETAESGSEELSETSEEEFNTPNLDHGRPAFWDWEDERIQEEIRSLVDGNLNNYDRIYDRMRIRHGIDVDEDLGYGNSYLDAMSPRQLRVALHVADRLLT